MTSMEQEQHLVVVEVNHFPFDSFSKVFLLLKLEHVLKGKNTSILNLLLC